MTDSGCWPRCCENGAPNERAVCHGAMVACQVDPERALLLHRLAIAGGFDLDGAQAVSANDEDFGATRHSAGLPSWWTKGICRRRTGAERDTGFAVFGASVRVGAPVRSGREADAVLTRSQAPQITNR